MVFDVRLDEVCCGFIMSCARLAVVKGTNAINYMLDEHPRL